MDYPPPPAPRGYRPAPPPYMMDSPYDKRGRPPPGPGMGRPRDPLPPRYPNHFSEDQDRYDEDPYHYDRRWDEPPPGPRPRGQYSRRYPREPLPPPGITGGPNRNPFHQTDDPQMMGPNYQQKDIPIVTQPGKNPYPPITNGGGLQQRNWATGLCDCAKDVKICCSVFCCAYPFMCMMVDSDFGESCWLPWPCCLGPVPTLVALRARLRDQEGIHGSVMDDCMVSTCCFPCALCQLKRESDLILRGEGIPRPGFEPMGNNLGQENMRDYHTLHRGVLDAPVPMLNDYPDRGFNRY